MKSKTWAIKFQEKEPLKCLNGILENVFKNVILFGGIYMKTLWITLAVMFIVATLGFVDVEMDFTDGSRFTYKGWLHLFCRR